MRTLLAVLFGVAVIVLSILFAARRNTLTGESPDVYNGREHVYDERRIHASLSSNLVFYEHTQPYLGAHPSQSTVDVTSPDDLSSRIALLRLKRNALPPIPSADDPNTTRRRTIKAQYDSIDRRIHILDVLYDQYRTALAAEDARDTEDLAFEAAQASGPAKKEATPPQRFAASDNLAPSASRVASVDTVATEASTSSPAPPPPPRPAPKPKPSLRSRISESITEFFEYCIENRHDTLQPILLGSFYYLVLLLGIITGAIYDSLASHHADDERVPAKQVLSLAASPSSWQGLLASPLIFAVIRGSMPDSALSFGMTLLAFQNGFFWRVTLKGIEVAVEKRAARKKAQAEEEPVVS